MSAQHEAAILAAVRAIPKGSVSSYGAVARAAGLPRRARQVGRVLRETGADSELPWFRVVRADGSLAFPVDSDAYAEQRERLAAEGIILVRNRVPKRYFGQGGDLDALLWGPGR